MESEQKASLQAAKTQITLRGLLLEQLGRIHDGEAHLASEVPRFLERVASHRLKSLLRDWLVEIHEHGKQLNEIANKLEVPLFEGTSRAIRSAVEHERNLLAKLPMGSICDTTIIEHGIQELEHQLSGYEAAAGYAHELGESWVSDRLRKTLYSKAAQLKGFRAMKDYSDKSFQTPHAW